ncbi:MULTISPECIES: hypothetical protein [Sulfurimonas]|uniref:hypothetical protein n=1 Tax=Sulfurimonas TaxID=202746 RepID=UPI00125FE6FC|nr:hypothetical protein [Sulfurimonas hydrogeniphila]
MHTYQIAESVLDGYKNEKLTDERVGFLTAQVHEQLDEIAKNKALYEDFSARANAPKKVDKIILWILLMSNESICDDYISACSKNYREIIPISDLADLLLYVIHLKKVQNTELDGFDYLVECEEAGIEEVDQYAFTNALLYIQKLKEKEVEMQF